MLGTGLSFVPVVTTQEEASNAPTLSLLRKGADDVVNCWRWVWVLAEALWWFPTAGAAGMLLCRGEGGGARDRA